MRNGTMRKRLWAQLMGSNNTSNRPILPPIPEWNSVAIATLGGYAVLGGLLSFVGWPADMPRLTDWGNSGISIQPNTALAAAAAGAAILLLLCNRNLWALALGTLVAVLGATTFFQHLSAVDFGIDTLLLFGREWGRTAVVFPGRMGPPAAASWTLIGISILLTAGSTAKGGRWLSLAATSVLATAAISSLSLIGYLYGADLLYSIPTATAVALQTSSFILAISVGLLLIANSRGWGPSLTDPGAAGVVVRTLLPAIIAVPLVFGLLRIAGQRAELYNLEFGEALRTLLEIVLLLGLLFLAAHLIGRLTRARAQAERAAAESDWRLRTIFESAPVALWEEDTSAIQAALGRLRADGVVDLPAYLRSHPDFVNHARRLIRVLEINETAVSLLQATDKSELVQTLPQLLGTAALPAFTEQLIAMAEGRASYQTELRLRTQGDSERIVIVNVVLQSLATVSRAFVSLTDVTEHRRAEERAEASKRQLLDTLERITDGLVILDQNWRITYMNPEAERLLQVSAQVLLGQVARETHPESFGGVTWQELHRAMAEQVVVAGESFSPDLAKWLSSRAYPTPDGGIAVYFRNITERKQAEEKLRHNQQQLELADRRKDDFLAVLAHELRNPLAPIRQATQIAKSSAATEEQKRWGLEVIGRQVKQMALLIDDLLDASRIARGTLMLRTTVVDLAAMIGVAVETARPNFEARNHHLTLSLPLEPVRFVADPLRLAQVVANLLTNATKFTEPSGNIQLTATYTADTIRISVSDNGIGLSPEHLNQIFDLYAQVQVGSNRHEGGLGIGLSLAQKLVRLHGGEISAHSAGLGQGSEFVVQLPRRLQGDENTGAEGLVETSPPSGPRRVLIADDNRDAADSLAVLLRMQGHDVSVAHDGPTALAAYDERKPEVMLLDIGMPGMTGYDVARQVRQRADAAVILIALTSWGKDSDIANAMDAGFDRHLTKPVDPELIMQLLET